MYDGRAIPVEAARRTVSGTAKAAPKVGGPVRDAGQIFDRTRALRPPVWSMFLSGALKELYGPFYDPRGDALSIVPSIPKYSLFL